MRIIRDLSIRYKLALLLLAVVSVVLLAVSLANVVSDVQATRATLAAKYSTLAKIVAAQSGAALSIADVDASGAQQIMSDLAVAPSIYFASLCNAEGTVVASYPARTLDQRHEPQPETVGATFNRAGFLDVVEEVRLNDGSVIGRIYLCATTEELQVQIHRTLLIAVVVYLMALGIALLLSFVLQRFISAPILQLAQLTQRVSSEHNYGLTAKNHGNDELGVLCDGFNRMLAEIRRRDDELERSNNELMQSNDELRQFAFVASHDLQEPLRSITSFCNLLKDDYAGRLDRQADEYIKWIVQGSARMRALITGLLSYSRVSKDEQLVFDSVDLLEVMQDALANLQSSIQEAGAEVTWGDLPTVRGIRVQLVQLLQNLIGNGILYRSGERPRIHIEAERVGDHWDFSVSDNGIGIAPEHHQQIFEIFKRLHNRSRYPGTGIGLAVCKKIVHRHGGQICVESQLGKGSCFRFTIYEPLTEDNSDVREPQLATTV
ncbi:MAG: ATP-binding protein [Pirellulales bacterium]